jgi:hypothetical protein
MEGPIEFIEGIAVGTRNLVGSAVGGAAGAVAKISGAASKGLATLTFDDEYQNARKEVTGHNVSDVLLSGKNIGKVNLIVGCSNDVHTVNSRMLSKVSRVL